jgi:N-acetyl-anhydromuramyl-L-alanine amidase AmpD
MLLRSVFLSGLVISSILVSSCNQNVQINQENQDITALSNAKKLKQPEFISMPSVNSSERPADAKISAIILHHTASASDAKSIGKFFQNPEAKVSAHYTVDRTGYIVQSVDDSLKSWHAGKSQFNGVSDVNNFSIGIEICNLGDNKDPYPEAQYDSLIKLVSYLSEKYDVPTSNITRHRDICVPAGRKSDTSDNFSVKKVLDGVKSSLEGTYNPPSYEIPKPLSYPDYREISTTEDERSLRLIADEYLDNEIRWYELKMLNPHIKNVASIPVGTKIKIPTSFKYFEKAIQESKTFQE